MAKRKARPRAVHMPPPAQLGGRTVIVLHTCGCPHCKGRGAACANAFSWLAHDNDHVLSHAAADLLGLVGLNDGYDNLPASIKDALRSATINVCARCANGWLEVYGEDKTAQLIRDVRFVDDTHAITPLDGWQG